MKNIHVVSIVLLIILIVTTSVLLAQKSKTVTPANMDSRWKKVEEYAGKNLPESALKEVEAILAQAKSEKNSPQIIKAMVNRIRFITEKNPDEFLSLLKEFEDYASKSPNPIEKAVMQSMTAQLYFNYYTNDRWTIDRRTDLAGTVPEDIKEWTKNIFQNKIVEQLNFSMENAAILKKTDVLTYAVMLEKGKDSRIMQPTLFDFLSYRRIEILKNFTQNGDEEYSFAVDTVPTVAVSENQPADENPKSNETIKEMILDNYNQLIDFNRTKNNTPAVVYAELQKLQFEYPSQDDTYWEKLNKLEKEYSNNESVVEILVEKAQYYLNKSDEDVTRNTYRKQAYDIVQDGIKRFPTYKRIGLLKNIQNIILEKNIQIQNATAVKPNSELKIKIQSKNMETLQLSVYKINATAKEYLEYKANRGYNKKRYPKSMLVGTKNIVPEKNLNFTQTETETTVKTGDYGIYELVLEEKENKGENRQAVSGFTVTDFAFILRDATINGVEKINKESKTNAGELYLLDRASGKPYTDAVIHIYNQRWAESRYLYDFVNNVKAQSDGKYRLPTDEKNNHIVIFERGNDKYFTSQTYNYWYSDNDGQDVQTKVSLFTDRSLYRPGQTVYFKGIAYVSNKNKQEIVKNQTFDVNLYNANGERINTKKLSVNDFGSFAGEFILPDKGLNGAYRLETANQSIHIWVEEYKRPTFEVTMQRPKEEVRFGDEATIKGNVKAYAGYNINDADVKYRVVRVPHRFCWWFNEPEKVIITGTTKTDAEGNFVVKFIPKKDKTNTALPYWIAKNPDISYTYTVRADVTDPKGETQQGEQSLSVGDKSLFILVQVPDKVDKSEKLTLDIITQTLNGENVISDINYTVISLKNPDAYFENTDDKTVWKENGTILSGRISTKDKLNLDLKKLNSGLYKILFTTKDNRGNEVTSENKFILYDKNDKRPPIKTYKWFLPVKTEVAVGENAQINFGTSTKNTFVLYELMNGRKVLESKWIEFNDEIKSFQIPFKAEYEGGVTVQFTFVKDEQLFTQSVNITKKTEEKKLTPTMSVFRDKLQPGEKAEWTITIPETVKGKKTAELLIGMYDASLDALRSHAWNFNPTYYELMKFAPQWTGKGFETGSDYAQTNNEMHVEVPDYQFDDFNWFGMNFGEIVNDELHLSRESALPRKSEKVMGVNAIQMDAVAESSPMDAGGMKTEDNEIVTVGYAAQIRKEPKPKPALRTNFNETAFFYPQLKTDEKGNVKVSFTAPESLTRWHVKMLAHTQDLYFGQNETFAVTQKELMAQMNLPRFVRRSDKLTLTANVVNLSETSLSPEVRLEIINPENNQIISLESSDIQRIKLNSKETKSVEWQLPEMKELDLVVVRITAQTENFSDGEQKYLPVLPDKVLVTESQTMTLRAGQKRTFTFNNFIQNLKNVDTKSFIVEYTGNPAWYAVQALPYVAAPTSENAIDYLTAYYANTLGSYIANANPALKSTFEKWKKADNNSLLSNLEKNQELKNMLLEETPWVTEAKDETEQKRQIALLFDLNQTQNKAATYMEKMLKLQHPSGGFSWFEGLPENRYITQEILLHLARLNKMTGGKTLTSYLLPLTSALKYLDMEISKDFFELKKWDKDYQKHQTINNLQLFYLHTRSEYPQIPIDKNVKEAVDYYTSQSEKYWKDWTLYGKAMMATVAYRNGKTKVADEILNSIRENAMKTDEMGMYWAKNTAGWWWHERPIATQTAVMEAFNEIRHAGNDIDEMKIWLLKQKQTQRWDTPISTLDAIYALLNYGTDWLSSKGDAVITVGNIHLNTNNAEAGTAYVKETFPVSMIKPEMGKMTVESKNTSGISWGAAYWQYYQDADKVQSQGKELKISKKLFVEKITKQGKSMLPIEQTTLKKGDKIITRLVVTTDRDLEFVSLKDLRAACFEPVNQLSGCAWKEGTIYYQTTKDASTQFFFQSLPKGTYVFEYELWVNNIGTYSSGMAEIQCQYAPEFNAHASGEKLTIK